MSKPEDVPEAVSANSATLFVVVIVALVLVASYFKTNMDVACWNSVNYHEVCY